jgi:hypothetical protein
VSNSSITEGITNINLPGDIDGISFLIGFLASFGIWLAHTIYTQSQGDNRIRYSNFVRRCLNYLGIRWKWYQYFKLGSFFILFILLLYLVSTTQKPIIIGSLLGAFPPVLIEIDKRWRKPNIRVKNIKITKYPKSWHTFGEWRADENANNNLRLQIEVENRGRGTAKDCQIKIRSDKINSQKYHTRWSESKQIKNDLSPNESKTVDALWMDLESTGIYTPSPKQDIVDNHYPPGSYDMIHRPELSTGNHSFSMEVTAKGKTQRTEEIPNLSNIEIPDDLLDLGEDWEVINTIKNVGEKYVIYYNINKEKIIEVSEWVDMKILSEIDEFSREEIGAKQSETYKEALERKFTIKKQD